MWTTPRRMCATACPVCVAGFRRTSASRSSPSRRPTPQPFYWLALTGENRYHSVLGYHDCVRVHPSSLAPALYVLDAQVVLRTR